MFARPGFSQRRSNGALSGSNPVPVAALPNIHDEATQGIQGGTAGERYHITQAQYDSLVANLDSLVYRLEHPYYTESVTDATFVNVATAGGSLVTIQVET